MHSLMRSDWEFLALVLLLFVAWSGLEKAFAAVLHNQKVLEERIAEHIDDLKDFLVNPE